MKGNDVYGILVVDKPPGWTSHDVVNKTRKLLGGIKVGHTGTLDPLATGVLVLLLGKATKMAPLFASDSKRYTAEITFGRATATYDADGETTSVGDPGEVDIDELKKIVDDLVCVTEQIPPMFSAVKVGGKKLYEHARAGRNVKREPRPVKIFSVVSDLDDFPIIRLDIMCSKGTYIRSLAHDIGAQAGCPSFLSGLRRTEAGRFTLDNALTMEVLKKACDEDALDEHIISPENMADA